MHRLIGSKRYDTGRRREYLARLRLGLVIWVIEEREP
jgi:hypothetical protein